MAIDLNDKTSSRALRIEARVWWVLGALGLARLAYEALMSSFFFLLGSGSAIVAFSTHIYIVALALSPQLSTSRGRRRILPTASVVVCAGLGLTLFLPNSAFAVISYGIIAGILHLMHAIVVLWTVVAFRKAPAPFEGRRTVGVVLALGSLLFAAIWGLLIPH